MRSRRAAVAALALLNAPLPGWSKAPPAPRLRVDLSGGPLAIALDALGRQAGATIGTSDAALAGLSVRAVHGTLTPEQALSRMLAGTAARAVRIDALTFRIVARPARPSRASDPSRGGRPPPPPVPAPPATVAPGTIVVTASKTGASVEDFAGTANLLDPRTLRPGRLAHGSEAMIAELPVLTGTHLGPGRNKLFIRGVADSSFAGPTQATVGQYLGDVRLTYNAPDPDLALYDMASVEVLEGPQGTLYGAGSLGGIIRLVPNAPDLDVRSGSVAIGAALLRRGAAGGDGSLVANIPIVPGTLAVRVLGYGAVDGGYIDDPLRKLKDINRTLTRGGRATTRWAPGGGWTVDIGGLAQAIDSRDGQYADRGLPAFERRSRIAQPFDSDYRLGSVVVRHDAGSTQFVSATSVVSHHLDTVYDASRASTGLRRFTETNAILLLSNETRLSHHGSRTSWVVGTELLHSTARLHRTLGPPGAEDSLSATRNVVEEGSAFGEVTFHLFPRLELTGGGRVAYDRLVGNAIARRARPQEFRRRSLSLLPSAGLVWKPFGRWSVYARYEEGYRPGGLSVQTGGAQRFGADTTGTWETGVRFASVASPFSARIGGAYTRWKDIQADLIDRAGLPLTANIGDGRVAALEAQLNWRPLPRVALEGAVFVTDSDLQKPAAGFRGQRDDRLPNIADITANGSLRYAARLWGRPVDLSGSARYVGHSRLGVGTMLDLEQGGYVDVAAGAEMPLGRFTVSLDATNLLDHRGNIFSYGNPFTVAAGRQITPLRPRTVRLGLAARL